jgi:flagellar biosynthesis/type III secretory pathway M-ring protein FliF/YscJ
MNFETIKKFLKDIVNRWNALKLVQKIVIVSVAALIPSFIGLVIAAAASSNYVVLYSAEQMQNTDISKVKSYLDAMKIPYTVSENNLLFVPKSDEQQTRAELALYGLPKITSNKGYEIFDSTTWIKGEKELQILELRALKGQLEQDLSHFENVKSASVILDIAPQRIFGNSTDKTKASVILDLVPGTRLGPQELRAITYHVTSAVRGLSPNMVAISDTTGRSYQGLDYDGTQDSIRSAEISAEDYIKAKIDGMLATVVGFGNFFTTVQVVMTRDRVTEERTVYSGTVDGTQLGQPVISSISKKQEQQSKTLEDSLKNGLLPSTAPKSSEESGVQQTEQLSVPMDVIKTTTNPGKIVSISIGVLIDDRSVFQDVYSYNGELIFNGNQRVELKHDIENQLANLLKGYNVKINQAVDFVSFDRVPAPVQPIAVLAETNANTNANTNTLLFIIITITAAAILFMLFRLQQKSRDIPSTAEKEQNRQQAEKKSLASLEETLDEARARMRNHPNAAIGTLHRLFDVLTESLGEEKAKAILRDIEAPIKNKSSLKTILTSAKPQDLAAFFYQESPQTIALMLYFIETVKGAEILLYLPLEKQIALMIALLQMDELDPDTLQVLLKKSAEMFGEVLPGGESNVPNSLKVAAALLRQLDKDKEAEILLKIEEKNPAIAAKIKNFLFVFDKEQKNE